MNFLLQGNEVVADLAFTLNKEIFQEEREDNRDEVNSFSLNICWNDVFKTQGYKMSDACIKTGQKKENI